MSDSRVLRKRIEASYGFVLAMKTLLPKGTLRVDSQVNNSFSESLFESLCESTSKCLLWLKCYFR